MKQKNHGTVLYKNKVRRDMSEKQKYIDFEAYERVAEPHKRERVSAWRTAIGLQDVDGLRVSDYLKEIAVKHIEGDITIDEVRE